MRKKIFHQVVIIFMAIAILVAGTFYLKSIIWDFWCYRNSMKSIAQDGTIQGWTDSMNEEYHTVQNMLENNSDPIARWAYNCNDQMHVVSVVVVIVMLFAFDILKKANRRLIKMLTKKRKQRQQQKPQQPQQPQQPHQQLHQQPHQQQPLMYTIR